MESVFLDRLRTNYAPSDEEIERIQNYLDLQTKEFDRLKKLIQNLCSERDKIGDYLDSHKALISLPRRLPRDIVQEIFLACLPTDRNAVMSPTEAPLLLCRICSAWRNIAHTTPQLWASIHIPFHFVLEDERRMPAFEEWLQRSAACPLSLSLVGDIWDHGSGWDHSNIFLSSKGVGALCKLLIKTAPRWRCAELASFDATVLLRFVEVHAPMLELLKISGDLPVASDDEPFNESRIALLEGERLRELHLYSGHPRTFVPDADWNRLGHLSISTFLHLREPEADSIYAFEVLRSTPRLLSLECGSHMMIQHLSEPLTLPFLHKFVISDRSSIDALDDLFEKLWMPDLRYIALPPQTDAASALERLSKKSPLVQHLSCSVPSFIGGSANLDMAIFFPALTHLELMDSDWGNIDDILSRLTPGPEPQSSLVLIYPALTELVVDQHHSLPVDVLQTFLERRVGFGTPFRRLAIQFKQAPDRNRKASFENCIAPFRDHGLDVSITFPPSPWGLSSEVHLSPWIGLPSYDGRESA
ncbi:hypothetical protein B0H16DRAFT_1513875 [Mycena metata]|uniref:F-box domain-containing protein n=1 Tax=Mycena metata TaxID=1033252 RepID=A0AAD7JVS0_9AGAR|nr:hypothetical protein B0H16DRAFT_1513875 [Mycena metata]